MIDTQSPDAEPQAEREHQTHFDLQYAAASTVEVTDQGTQVALPGNLLRPPVNLDARVKYPLRFREALATLYTVVGSDYRYVPKDRTAYMAYRRMKQESANMNVWQAQQAYFDWLSRNDPLAWVMLDPIISVHPDQVFFEVFSKDEGVYANVGLDMSAFDLEQPPVCGTTNIDFSQALIEGIMQMRSYRETRLTIGQQAVKLSTAGGSEVLEKKINVPDSWLRGFLQVQSAATLPKDSFSISPLDLYNVLRQLRLHGDRKGKRRGLRIELVPGEKPILVLEPWDVVIRSSGEIYRGRQAKVVRVWGRRRLLLLRRLLGFADRIDVHLLGSGLPSFWVLRAKEITVTLGLTGFTAANWSQAVNFDLLLPRESETPKPLEAIVRHLADVWFERPAGLKQVVGSDGAALLRAAQLGCQHGRMMYDLAGEVYRLRPLTEQQLDLEKLEFRSIRERQAHDFLARKSAVKIVSKNRIYEVGLALAGKVAVTEDKREYRPEMVLTDEGNVSKADCTCTFHRQQGLKAGPCAHLIALRLAYSLEQAQRRKRGDTRETLTSETRTFSKRTPRGETIYQLSLDKQRLQVRWSEPEKKERIQNFQFNSHNDASEEYLRRVEALQANGYLDATGE